MTHKLVDDSLERIFNYMSSPKTNQTFIGFIPVVGDIDSWCVEHFGLKYCAVHMTEKEFEGLYADDDKEDKDLEDKKYHFLNFVGIDNTSYIKRFHTQEQALRWFYDTPCIDVEEHNLLYWNS